MYVHTCVFECLSVKILSKYLETDAKTDEWLRVAIFPHFKITSQSGFCPFPSKLDLCCFKDASKASLKVIFSGASIWGRPSDLFTLHFWVLVFDDEAVDLVCQSGTVCRDRKKVGLNLAQRAGLAVIATKAYELSSTLLQTLHFEFAFALWCSSVIFHWSFSLKNCKTFGHWCDIFAWVLLFLMLPVKKRIDIFVVFLATRLQGVFVINDYIFFKNTKLVRSICAEHLQSLVTIRCIEIKSGFCPLKIWNWRFLDIVRHKLVTR